MQPGQGEDNAPSVVVVGIRDLRRAAGLSHRTQLDGSPARHEMSPYNFTVRQDGVVQLSPEQRMFWWKRLGLILKIQRWFRRRSAARNFTRGLAARSAGYRSAYEHENAEIIQRCWRGYRARTFK
jgi:hypothetical protein